MKRKVLLILTLAVTTLTSGCAVYPYDPYYAAPAAVVVGPPPPVVVVRPYYGYRYYGRPHYRRWCC
mgnify:CR=1 FL=1